MPQPLGPSTVAVSELRSAVGAILDAVESELGETIELNADHYWLLESAESFDPSKTPDVVAGQLSDDVDSIRAIAEGGEVVVWHDIDHLLGLLRRVSALAAP
jgi:hypothetical protein